jgi:hypothetical protein
MAVGSAPSICPRAWLARLGPPKLRLPPLHCSRYPGAKRLSPLGSGRGLGSSREPLPSGLVPPNQAPGPARLPRAWCPLLRLPLAHNPHPEVGRPPKVRRPLCNQVAWLGNGRVDKATGRTRTSEPRTPLPSSPEWSDDGLGPLQIGDAEAPGTLTNLAQGKQQGPFQPISGSPKMRSKSVKPSLRTTAGIASRAYRWATTINRSFVSTDIKSPTG